MKKLVSLAACLLICFAIQAQTQSGGRAQITPQSSKAQVEKPSEEKSTIHNCATHKAADATACPKAATCQKSQAANSQGDAKKACCAKHQEGKTTEQKAGCNHQNADQKTKCNHNHGEKTSCPKKTEEKK